MTNRIRAALALSLFWSFFAAAQTSPHPAAAPRRIAVRAARLLDVKTGQYVERPGRRRRRRPHRERRHNRSRPARP